MNISAINNINSNYQTAKNLQKSKKVYLTRPLASDTLQLHKKSDIAFSGSGTTITGLVLGAIGGCAATILTGGAAFPLLYSVGLLTGAVTAGAVDEKYHEKHDKK